MTKYTLTSAKATYTSTGDLAHAIRAAMAMEDSLQPSHGVTIEFDGNTFECRDGGVAVTSTTGSEDDEDGTVRLVGNELMICWDQGIRTPFSAAGLIPA